MADPTQHPDHDARHRRSEARRDPFESTVFADHAAPIPDDDLIGTRLDHYQVHSILGQGTMGRVYLAWNERLHRQVAIKVIAPELARAEPVRLEMFLAEARSAARLQHPHIVTVHSLGSHQGYTYIEMEFVPGVTLRKLCEKGDVPTLLAATLLAQAASGLVSAHAHGVIHRDVKPDNILVADGPAAKLGDFGLARIRTSTPAAPEMVGSPAFMAPELFRGQPATRASDIYALGATLYSLLAGRVPFESTTLRDMRQKHEGEPVPSLVEIRPDVPSTLDELVRAMMAKDPADRPSSQQELVVQLRSIANSLIPTCDLVAQGMQGTDVVWDQMENHFTFDVRLADGRGHRVLAELAACHGERIMSFWTPCAPADPSHYALVLEMNNQLPFGAVAIRPWHGTPFFVMIQNLPRDTLDPEEIRGAVLHMARWADHIELKLTGADVH